MRTKTTWGLVLALAPVSLATCAEGIEPPEPTAMVSITTNLTFNFGMEEVCKLGNDTTCAAVPENEQIPTQYPIVNVKLAPFAIDRDEVTNFQYEYCVAKGVCTEPQFGNAPDPTQFEYYGFERFRSFPVVNVTWTQAAQYCAFVGKRLPTELEWERVAKGGGAVPREFPVEAGFDDTNDCEGELNATGCGGDQKMEATGSSATDFVIEGGEKIFHLAANAAEWTDTWHDPEITCEGEPPCLREEECAGLPEGDRPACITASKNCTLCAPQSDCFYMCAGSDRPSIICSVYDGGELSPALFTPTSGSDKVIRGGSVSTTRNQRCLLHSWNRDQRNAVSFLGNFLGFRCAKSL